MATPATTTTTTTLMVVRTLMMLLVVMLMLMLLLPRTMMMLLSTATAVVVLPIVAHASATPTSTSQMMVGGAEDRVVQLVVDRVRVANAIRVRLMQMLRMGRLVMVVPMVTLVLLVRLLLLLDTVLLQGMRLHWLLMVLMVVEILAIVAPAGTTDSHIAQPVLERRYFARIVTTVRHGPVVAAEMVPHLLLIVESTTTATTRLYTALGGGKTMVHQGRLWLVHVHLLLVVLVRVGLLLLLPTTRLGHEFLRGRGQIEQLWRSNRLEVPGLRTPAPGIAMLLHAPNCTTDGCS